MSKVQQLQQAQQNQQIVDLFIRQTGDIYTGFVTALDHKWVIVHTYNDYGLLDGYVLLKISGIASVTTEGLDLKRLQRRIALTATNKIHWAQELAVPQFAANDLIQQLLDFLQRQQQAILVILTGSNRYLQVKLQDFRQEQLHLQLLDSFNFAKIGQNLTVDLERVVALEFVGAQLQLASTMFQTQHLQHTPSVLVKNNPELRPILQRYQQQQQLILLYCSKSADVFFAGQIMQLDQQFLVMKLLDHLGCFGGYALINLQDIDFVSPNCDYLQMLILYFNYQRQHKTLVQPVLDDQWQFGADFVNTALQRLVQQQNMVRFRQRDQMLDQLAYCQALEKQTLTLAVFEDLPDTKTSSQSLPYQQLAVLTWEYLNTFFTKDELID